MPAPIPPLHGEELLAAVTEAMVALHERYHHRVPVSAKTQLLGDDLIAVVMGGVYTEVEKTLIELGCSSPPSSSSGGRSAQARLIFQVCRVLAATVGRVGFGRFATREVPFPPCA